MMENNRFMNIKQKIMIKARQRSFLGENFTPFYFRQKPRRVKSLKVTKFRILIFPMRVNCK